MKKTLIYSGAAGMVFFLVFFVSDAVHSSSGMRRVPAYNGYSAIDPSKNHFIIFGDTRGKSPFEFRAEKNVKIRAALIDEIVKNEPAFVVNLGDFVLRGGSNRAWTEFDELNTGLREKGIPYFPILGNHEVQGDTEAGLSNYFMRFPHLNHQRWYSFTWKNIGFIMLDSNISSMTAEQRESQFLWYNAQLERFEKDEQVNFVIASIHEPPFTNRVKSPLGPGTTRLFADPFIRFKKTRLFLSGHVHSYERFLVGSKYFIVSGGGGAPRSKIIADPSERMYEDQFPGAEVRFFHFCIIEAKRDSLLFKVIRVEPDSSLSIADTLTIPRSGEQTS